jgi:hypothetical protein
MSPETAQVCADLLGAVPEQLDGQDRRDTSPPTESTAAWGDPPITLRCGVEQPARYDPTGEAVVVNDVEWYLEQGTGGTGPADAVVFTTLGRVARVELRVPSAYAPEVNPLVDLAAAVSANVPLSAPSG